MISSLKRSMPSKQAPLLDFETFLFLSSCTLRRLQSIIVLQVLFAFHTTYIHGHFSPLPKQFTHIPKVRSFAFGSTSWF